MVRRRDSGLQRAELVPLLLAAVVLLAIAVPGARRGISSWRLAHAENEMGTISAAFQRYHADTGYWPEKYLGESDRRVPLRNFDCFYDNTRTLVGWNGPYLEDGTDEDGKRVVAVKTGEEWDGLVDPWGRPYRVIYGRTRDSIRDGGIAILSSGPNLKFETSDDNALSGWKVKDDLVKVVTDRLGPPPILQS
jgi:hypothetical protein